MIEHLTPGQQRIVNQANSIMEKAMKQYDIALTSPQATGNYLRNKLAGLDREVFGALWLNNRHQLICFEELAKGTIDGAAVYPREVVKASLRHNAAAVIFCHNHPSGNAEPSQADIALTRKLKDALTVIDVRVLDHIIVGHENVSLAERGLM